MENSQVLSFSSNPSRNTQLPTLASEDVGNDLDILSPAECEIDVYRDGIHGNRCLLSPSDKRPLYWVNCSIFRRGVPDVTVYAGSDKQGAVVGVVHIIDSFSALNVGRGDPAIPNRVEWESLRKASRDHSMFKFSVDSGGEERRRSYVWKRTHDPTIKGIESSKLDRRSWKLVDEDTAQLVAVFASTGITSWKKTGTFRLLADQGKEWEEWVLLTGLGLTENSRRLAMARRDLSWFI